MREYIFFKRIIIAILGVFLIICACTTTANAATKSKSEVIRFYGNHTDYGPSVWGVNFSISVSYNNNSTNQYIAEMVSTAATLFPQHHFGNGDVIIAGLKESVDFGSEINRNIKPTTSSFWEFNPLIVETGTKIYYSYKGNPNRGFRYEFKEKGEYTFAVPDVYFANQNASLTLSVGGPK